VELGLLRWEGEVDFDDNIFDSDVDAETDVFFGIGLDYEVQNRWNAGLQIRRYNVSSQALMSWGLRTSYSF
jgi:outer membrane protein W